MVTVKNPRYMQSLDLSVSYTIGTGSGYCPTISLAQKGDGEVGYLLQKQGQRTPYRWLGTLHVLSFHYHTTTLRSRPLLYNTAEAIWCNMKTEIVRRPSRDGK